MVTARSRHRKAQEKYRENHLDEVRERDREYNKENKSSRAAYARDYRVKIKREVIDHYGGECKCCGVDELIWLTIDHIEGEGNIERRTVGSDFYMVLKRNHFPSGYQVLCHNCNFAKANGGCPHQIGKM